MFPQPDFELLLRRGGGVGGAHCITTQQLSRTANGHSLTASCLPSPHYKILMDRS